MRKTMRESRIRTSVVETLALLGVHEVEPRPLEIRVINKSLCIDLETSDSVHVDGSAEKIREEWNIFTLHYLSSCPPPVSE